MVMTEKQNDSSDTEVLDPETVKSMVKGVKRYGSAKTVPVLIADDSSSVCGVLDACLTKVDPRVVIYQAANGREALQKLEEVREKHNADPALIILDLNMPVMDGWETIKALKQDYEQAGHEYGVPLVVFSGTTGKKGLGFFGNDVNKNNMGYKPLATVAKNECLAMARYDATGTDGLQAWIQYFVKR